MATLVTEKTAGNITFDVPDGSVPTRYRIADQNGFGDWTATSSNVVSTSAEENVIQSSSPFEARVIELDIGSDILSQVYIIVSAEPLVPMVNSFLSMSEAQALAVTRFDMSNWNNASYFDKIMAMTAAYELLCGYRYFIYHERDSWGARQYAGYGLPFSEDYESVNTLEDYSLEEFNELRLDFRKRIKSAQLVVADTIIGSLSADPDDGLNGDPNLLSEKIGDTSRTWRAARVVQSQIGSRAQRIMANYISSTPRLVRN